MRKYLKALKIIGAILGVLILVYLGACKIASNEALALFNREIAKQTVLKGKITVEDINASMFGTLTFINLKWEDPEGNTIAIIPEGKIRVKPLDVVLRKFSTTTIQGLEINNAEVSLRFNKDMHIDVVNEKPKTPEEIAQLEEKRREERKNKTPEELLAARKKREAELRTKIRNIDFDGKRIDARITFNNCKLNAFYRNREFIINDVDADFNIDTTKEIDVNFTTGQFGGTMVGESIDLSGKIDMKKEIPTYDLYLKMNEIIPSSLGFGVNINDTVSISSAIKGELPTPIIEGKLHFDKLVIPGIEFSKVDGHFHYEDGLLYFNEVKALAFGGEVNAEGRYNINDRHYNIKADGKDLRSSIATKDLAFNCLVKLDFTMESDGNPKTALSYGTFSSGKGTYHLIPFNGIKGAFSNQNGTLDFTNVVISTDIGDVSSDAFSIIRGRVKLGPIYLKIAESGENIRIR